jgi:hypothetical protein
MHVWFDTHLIYHALELRAFQVEEDLPISRAAVIISHSLFRSLLVFRGSIALSNFIHVPALLLRLVAGRLIHPQMNEFLVDEDVSKKN